MEENFNNNDEETGLRLKDAFAQASRSKVIAILGVVVLIFGVLVATYLTQKQQTYKTGAQAKPVTVIISSPKPGEALAGSFIVRAQAKTATDIKKLYAVLKKDGKNPETLRIRKIDEGTVGLSTGLSSQSFTKGSHTFDIYLYNLSSGKPILVGQSSVKAVVK